MFDWGWTFGYVYNDKDKPHKENEKTIVIDCPYCGINTNAEIISRSNTKANAFIKLPHHEMSIYNFFLFCTRCNGAILILWSYGEEHRRGGISAGRIIFPFYTEAFEAREFGLKIIPSAILEDIKQAELSYYVNAYLGAALLLRRAIQNICRDKKCKETGNLVGQIKELVSKGIITKDTADLVDAVRIIGNEVAHPEPNTPFIITPEDVKICREFIKQLIQIIYINPYKAKILKEELASKGIK